MSSKLISLFYQPIIITKAPFTRYNLLSNRLSNRCDNPVWQPVERTVAVCSTRLSNRFSNRFYNRFDNRLYRVKGVSLKGVLIINRFNTFRWYQTQRQSILIAKYKIRVKKTHKTYAKCISNGISIIIRLEARLQPNIGNTLRPLSTVFTRLV